MSEPLSVNEKIRIAARNLKGFCRTKEVKDFVRTTWGDKVSAQSVWNVLGSEKTRILNAVNGHQQEKASELLDSVFGDQQVAIQLIKIEAINQGS